jgi:hypothetical protein
MLEPKEITLGLTVTLDDCSAEDAGPWTVLDRAPLQCEGHRGRAPYWVHRWNAGQWRALWCDAGQMSLAPTEDTPAPPDILQGLTLQGAP